MKARKYLAALFTVILCLSMTACGKSTSGQEQAESPVVETVEAAETTESSDNPAEETDAERPSGIVQTDDDSYADDAAKDREEAAAPAGTSSNQNPDGTYTWEVGNYTLTTRINVMDYIDGRVWRVNDMAAALGWDKNKRHGVARPMTFQTDDTYDIYINFTNSPSNDFCRAFFIEGNNRKSIGVLMPERQPDDYTFNDKDFTMSLEGIVSFAYACEYLSENPEGDPFDGILPMNADYYRFTE